MSNFARSSQHRHSDRFVTRNQVTIMDSDSSASVGSAARSSGRVWAPYCDCDVKAVIRIAKTDDNKGKKFWGCRYYKRNSVLKKDEDQEDGYCDFFEWYSEDTETQMELMMQRQRRKIKALKRSLKASRKWIQVLVGICILMMIVNLVVVLMLWSLSDKKGSSVKMYLN